MDNTRLRSYDFRCPCCNAKHKRLFEYYAKFHGLIGEDEPIPTHVPSYMLERVVLESETYESKSLTVTSDALEDKTYRCGNCYEFFKFVDNTSEPMKLLEREKKVAVSSFKPLEITYEKAVMNAMATLDAVINKNGCAFDEDSKEVVIFGERGKEYRLKIDDELVKAFYADNPMFQVKKVERCFEQRTAE